jgi:hypothetical protein
VQSSIRAVTIWQPWASLIIIGAKPYEFRYRSYLAYINHPQPGERIAIHAGVRPVKRDEVLDLLARLDGHGSATGLIDLYARPLLERVLAAHKCRLLPLGAVLGTAVIGKPRNAGTLFGRTVEDSDRGLFNWAWPLTSVEKFDVPVHVGGRQGFWRWTP